MMDRRRQTVTVDNKLSDEGFDLMKELALADENGGRNSPPASPLPDNSSRSSSPSTPPQFPSRINIARREQNSLNTPSPKAISSPMENPHASPTLSTSPTTPSMLKAGTMSRIYRKFTTLLKPNNLFKQGRTEVVRFVPDRKPAQNPTTIQCDDIESEFALVVQERASQAMALHKLSIMYMKMRSKKEDSIDMNTPTGSFSPIENENFENVTPQTPSTPLRRSASESREFFEERLIEVTRSQHLLIYKVTSQIRSQLPHNPPLDYEKCFMLSDDFSVSAGGLTTIKLKGGKSQLAYSITITFLAFYTLTFAVLQEEEYQDWLDVFRVHVMRNTATIPYNHHMPQTEVTEQKVIEEYNMLVEQRDEWIRTMGNTRYLELVQAYAETILKNKS